MADSSSVVAPPRNGVGESVRRPDGTPKVRGEFEFSSDLQADGMLWGRTLRSPHAYARIVAIDIGPALTIAGVAAILTADDVPGKPHYGLIAADQPVLARDVVRYQGEPVAIVAADHPDTCRRALDAIVVDYEVLEPLTDPELAADAAPIHPDGNVIRTVPILHGDQGAVGDVIIEGTYETAMQDQAFMGPESGMAVPDGSGGVDLHVATQWLHEDRDQTAACLGLAPEEVRVHLAGTGGAFGAREDLSMHVHACLLALHTNRPVKMTYLRDESFVGHVHRHPAKMWFRHHANADGHLVRIEARVLLDGGAYSSSSHAVIANSARYACGPYNVPNATIDAICVRTNNPPCGAMRGFGAVQVCFGHESQMDKLAAALEMDPVELRLRNAIAQGDHLPTGQLVHVPAPVRECLEAAVAFPLPPPVDEDDYALPGGAGRTADRAEVRRGIGYAVGFKNQAFAEGFIDDTHARCRLDQGGATLTSATAEVGQGFVTIAGQIARTILGVEDVTIAPASTAGIGSAGSTSASRQTYLSGAAVEKACREVAEQVRAMVAETEGVPVEALGIRDGRIVTIDGSIDVAITDVSTEPVEATVRHMHQPTFPMDPETGQGDSDVSWIFAAQRAVVDVDVDLGLVRVVQITTGQDVGNAINPQSVTGQIEGGVAQGVGLAVMEEMIMVDGLVQNPSFTDYLIPTFADMPSVEITLVEEPEEGAPFGAKGVGETPSIPSTPAVAAAIRAATGLGLTRVPIRPQDIALP